MLDYEGLDFATVLESIEDHLGLRQSNASAPSTWSICIWRALDDDREAVLDGSRLSSPDHVVRMRGPSFCANFRTMAQMLPLNITATGVNPVFEARLRSLEDLEEIVHVGPRLTAAFGDELELHELVWNAPMEGGGESRFRMRLRGIPCAPCWTATGTSTTREIPATPCAAGSPTWITQELAACLSRASRPFSPRQESRGHRGISAVTMTLARWMP